MKLNGTVSKVLPAVAVGQKGTKIGGLVINFSEFDRPKLLHLKVFERNLGKVSGLVEHDQVEVEFSAESREYQGKYYTDCLLNDVKVFATTPTKKEVKNEEFKVADTVGGFKDDLPFVLLALFSLGSILFL
jgi:hypothetical protein